MKPTPLIGITTYHRDERGYIQLPAAYADSVRRAGGIPLLIQPGEPRIEELLSLLDAVILSGGGDLDPALYTDAQHETVYWVDKERDEFEIDLTKRLMENDKPLLCICRGLQVLNVALGGTLITNIADSVPEAIAHRQPPRNPILHEIIMDNTSRLAQVMQNDHPVSQSWHHQSIDKLAPGLKVVGTAPDGVIEAVEIPDKPQIMAVQWHPELTAHQDSSQQRLFDELVRLSTEA
jgi:putative glutamine amidotransferase